MRDGGVEEANLLITRCSIGKASLVCNVPEEFDKLRCRREVLLHWTKVQVDIVGVVGALCLKVDFAFAAICIALRLEF